MRIRYLTFPNGVSKAVTFSYDDGCLYDVRLSRTLSQYNLKGTFNINSGLMGKDTWHIPAETIKEEIIDRGHEIAVHGQYHIAPGVARPLTIIKDILNCRLELEKEFGGIVRGMAYPNSGIRIMRNGNDYATIREYIKDLDIVYGRTLGADNNRFEMPTDWLNWVPTIHHDNKNSLEWAQAFVDMKINELQVNHRFPRLFYVWGHSYEFNDNDNWEHLDDLLKILSGKNDIWYATNIEIYNYTKSYERLVFSADDTKVYNPNVNDVWFMQDGIVYCVKSGETIEMK